MLRTKYLKVCTVFSSDVLFRFQANLVIIFTNYILWIAISYSRNLNSKKKTHINNHEIIKYTDTPKLMENLNNWSINNSKKSTFFENLTFLNYNHIKKSILSKTGFAVFPNAFENYWKFFTFDPPKYQLDSLSYQKQVTLFKIEAFLLLQNVVTHKKKTHIIFFIHIFVFFHSKAEYISDRLVNHSNFDFCESKLSERYFSTEYKCIITLNIA
ncbi:Sec23 trunk domain-containing protein [Aphis craccivora]|uniref:Sec23 trunk domain-containing protein n=1 Tax=Aphis craccivora TaxID=307492 RepID=A0A6G0ZEN5_APHCR|nr:Sec23 trunk domain-containing protein [Aphis craccivora]